MTPKRSEISVLIATPNVMERELLLGALKRRKQFHVVDTAETAHKVLKAAQSQSFDVALITATLADGPHSGLGVVRQIRECFPQMRTVILLNRPERNLIVEVFRAGARGVFVLSSSPFKSLCRCVEQVHAGQIWADSAELSQVMEAFCQLAPTPVVNANGMRLLTRREEDVVRLLVEGMQNRDIARELKLSEHTVRNYLFHIFDKLGVSSRVELVMYAVTGSNRMQATDSRRDKKGSDPSDDLDLAMNLLIDEDRDSRAKSSQSQGENPNSRAWSTRATAPLQWAVTEPQLSRRSA